MDCVSYAVLDVLKVVDGKDRPWYTGILIMSISRMSMYTALITKAMPWCIDNIIRMMSISRMSTYIALITIGHLIMINIAMS